MFNGNPRTFPGRFMDPPARPRGEHELASFVECNIHASVPRFTQVATFEHAPPVNVVREHRKLGSQDALSHP
jgi:hypothetical protein